MQFYYEIIKNDNIGIVEKRKAKRSFDKIFTNAKKRQINN